MNGHHTIFSVDFAAYQLLRSQYSYIIGDSVSNYNCVITFDPPGEGSEAIYRVAWWARDRLQNQVDHD